MRETDPHKAVDYIIEHGKHFAEAKANRIYIEEYRKSLKAILMKRCLEPSVNAQEREAYADPEYVKLLDGLREAVEMEETFKWNLIAAQARVDIWRTEQANNRGEMRATI